MRGEWKVSECEEWKEQLVAARSSQTNFPADDSSQDDSAATGNVERIPAVDKSVDLDGDGALSPAEVQYAAFVHHGLSSNVIETLFNEVDKNGDGYLTSLEFNDIRPLVLAKAESAAQRYLQTVDNDHNGVLSLKEAQDYIFKEYGIGNRDVEHVWRLVIPNLNDKMDAKMFSKLRRRIRAMSIRLARLTMKKADANEDGHIDKKEAQKIAFEQEGISADDVNEMVISVDDNNDGELNAPEFADFQRIIRSRAIDISNKALKVVDRDGSGTVTMDEAKRIAFDHYGFDEKILGSFFAQADENEDGQLDPVEFTGFRTVIRSRAVKNALDMMQEIDTDGDGYINNSEAVLMARRQDDMDPKETFNLFVIADQDKNGKLDKVELADFLRLVRLSAIKFATDHFKEFDMNKDKTVTVDELEELIELKYKVERSITRQFFKKVDVDNSGDLAPGEIVDFRHEIRRYVTERNSHRPYGSNKSNEQGREHGRNTEEMISDGATRNSKSNRRISDTVSVGDKSDKSGDTTSGGNVERKGQLLITRSSKAEINDARGGKKDGAATLTESNLTEMTTAINAATMQTANPPTQFTVLAKYNVKAKHPEIATTIDERNIVSFDVLTNRSSIELTTDDVRSEAGSEQQPSTLPMRNDASNGGESESDLDDVAATGGRAELTPKSESLHEAGDHDSTEEQIDGDDDSKVKHNEDEMKSEGNVAMTDAKESDEEGKQQASDDDNARTKALMEKVDKWSNEEESAMKNTPATNRKKINVKTPSSSSSVKLPP
ncbi:unnamed protein product [Litomosoides sigmodontis]|uniref:EF-hand domain-containing protein n=1 Tax=Litomosoides sigmodontis TaxID=42156 RepID=A0A3P6U1Q9_LITSI|nr:unnamed protein product [Litomosoides sigmodontis]